MSIPDTGHPGFSADGTDPRRVAPKPGERPPCQLKPGAVSCQECIDFLTDYVDGVLPIEQKKKFEVHLDACADCAIFLDNYRKASALTGCAAAAERHRLHLEAPKDLVNAILSAIKHAKG